MTHSFSNEHTPPLMQFGPALLEHGYPIIPIRRGHKHPEGVKDWQHIEATPETLRSWLANGFGDRGGVGILTRDFPAIDIDVQDVDLVDRLVDWCELMLGETVRRVGSAPKQLLVFRAEQPFTKLASPTYVDMLGLEHRIEILGDGQQFVAYAEHPTTKRPYEWVSDAGLAETDPSDLPVLTIDMARDLLEYFETIIPDDWEIKSAASKSGAPVDRSVPEEVRALTNATPIVADLSDAKIRRCLELLADEADDYHGWVKVGMALFHQFDGSLDGFAHWDVWSQRSGKYVAEGLSDKWKSFAANLRTQRPVTFASVIAMAKEVHQQEQVGRDPLGHFLDRYVFIEKGNLVCDLNKPPHCAVSKLDEFRNASANVRHEVPAPTQADPGKTKMQPVHFAWLTDGERKTAQGTQYDPSKAFYYQDAQHASLWWVNEFYTPEFEPPTGQLDLKIFFDHMEYLFPVEREREWFISWMAFNLQCPEKRSKVTPLHISVAHGTGRGWVVELMGHLLGQWNCTKTKMATLAGEGSAGAYQDYLDRSLFCAIEEVREGSRRYGISDKTRDMLTENYLEVNLKYGGKRTQSVFTNFFFMSNHPDAVVLTREDRRLNVLQGPDKARSGAYYRKLYEWLTGENVAALWGALMARDLSGFDWQHSMETPARERMITNNQTETEQLFTALLDSEDLAGAMIFPQIVERMLLLSEKDAFETHVDEPQLLKLLQHHARLGERMKFGGRGGKAARPWVFNHAIEVDKVAIRQEVEKCGF